MKVAFVIGMLLLGGSFAQAENEPTPDHTATIALKSNLFVNREAACLRGDVVEATVALSASDRDLGGELGVIPGKAQTVTVSAPRFQIRYISTSAGENNSTVIPVKIDILSGVALPACK